MFRFRYLCNHLFIISLKIWAAFLVLGKMNQQGARFVASSNAANHFVVDNSDNKFQFKGNIFYPFSREILTHSGLNLKSQFIFCFRELSQFSFWPFNSHPFFHISLHSPLSIPYLYSVLSPIMCFHHTCHYSLGFAAFRDVLLLFSLMQLVRYLNFTWDFHSLIMTCIIVYLSDYTFV